MIGLGLSDGLVGSSDGLVDMVGLGLSDVKIVSSIQTVSLMFEDVFESSSSTFLCFIALQQPLQAETRTQVVKRMERTMRAICHPEQPSPKQR